jgi:ligand-binding sensor domain-containing protein
MIMKIIFPFLIFYFGVSWLPKSMNTDLIFKNITIADGLSESIVLDIAQDSLGFMWFATPEALNRYDGSEFKIFPKSFDYNTDPQDFKIGKLRVFGSELWMITKGGKLEVMNLENEMFSQITHFGKSGDLIPAVRSIFLEDENRIWLGTEDKGLYLVDRNMEVLKYYHLDASKSFKLISNRINDIFKDSLGGLWIATNSGLNKIDDNHVFTFMEGIASNLIIEDHISRLLVGTQKNGVYIADLPQEIFVPYRVAKNINFPSDLTVVALHLDLQYRLWIGSNGAGLYILENNILSHNLSTRNFNSSSSIKVILKIFTNKEKGIWIGTDGGGIGYFDESSRILRALMDFDSKTEVPIEQITAIATGMDSSVWYGTSGSGFVKFQPSTKTANAFSLKNLINNSQNNSDNLDRIRALSIDTYGDLWIASEGRGTFIFDTKNQLVKNWLGSGSGSVESSIQDNTLNCFLVENDTSMWAGAPSGLLLINKEKGLLKKYSISPSEEITTLTRINKSTLAVGFKNSGLAQFDTQSGEFFPIAFNFISENLNQIQFNSLLYINDWLWAGTAGRGLLATNIKTGDTKLFTKSDGLLELFLVSLRFFPNTNPYFQ